MAERLPRVVDDGVDRGMLADPVREGAGIGGAAVAMAGARLQFGARARPPDDAAVVHDPVHVVGEQPRRAGIGLEPALGVGERDAAGVPDDAPWAGGDGFVAAARGELEVGTDRDDDVAADIHALEAVAEAAARILADIA